MGSQSDYSVMKNCEKILKILKIKYQVNIVSAHRTPDRMFNFAKIACKSGFGVIVAGAGGSAHLPGMVASLSNLPVIGVSVGVTPSATEPKSPYELFPFVALTFPPFVAR